MSGTNKSCTDTAVRVHLWYVLVGGEKQGVCQEHSGPMALAGALETVFVGAQTLLQGEGH